MTRQTGFWKLFENDLVVTLLLAGPLAVFLLMGYFNEESVKTTMPFFLYTYSLIFSLLSVHAIKRRIFQFFDRGPVFMGKNPISFWVLVSVQFIVAMILFAAATIYIMDSGN